VLSISDLFLLTSESESFGLAALEAMAAGVPVISTNTGGIPEVNINGITGYTSNVGDVAEMAENTIKLLSNELLFAEFKKNALLQAQKFDISKVLPVYEALYQKVLSQQL
jgi:glycosyltransferase involved in cell wall biosynthesis